MAKKKAVVSKNVKASKTEKTGATSSKPQPPKTRGGESTGTRAASAAKASAPMACEAIGECAGSVWCCLYEQGPQSLAKLKKSVDASPELLLAAVGWLAREGKLSFETNGKQVTIALVQ